MNKYYEKRCYHIESVTVQTGTKTITVKVLVKEAGYY